MKKIFTDIFIKFNNGEYTDEMLIAELRKIENIIKSRQNNSLPSIKSEDIWFRFFDDDPCVTLISDIENDLKFVTNRDYIKKCIKICIETNSLIVEFS